MIILVTLPCIFVLIRYSVLSGADPYGAPTKNHSCHIIYLRLNLLGCGLSSASLSKALWPFGPAIDLVIVVETPHGLSPHALIETLMGDA